MNTTAKPGPYSAPAGKDKPEPTKSLSFRPEPDPERSEGDGTVEEPAVLSGSTVEERRFSAA
jgi:hypothetical protein